MNNVKSRMKIAYGRCRPTNGVAAFLFLAISLFILQSCGSSCEETREAYLVAELENESGATLSAINVWGLGQQATYVETLADTVTTWNEVTGEVYDTIIYTRVYADDLMLSETSPETLEFFLNPEAEETRLRLQITATANDETVQVDDTLTVRYTAEPYLIDMECGCTIRFDIQSVEMTNHLLRDITIDSKTITNKANVNLTITY